MFTDASRQKKIWLLNVRLFCSFLFIFLQHLLFSPVWPSAFKNIIFSKNLLPGKDGNCNTDHWDNIPVFPAFFGFCLHRVDTGQLPKKHRPTTAWRRVIVEAPATQVAGASSFYLPFIALLVFTKTFFKYLPVWDFSLLATSSGVPLAISSPPFSPPSGPRSII